MKAVHYMSELDLRCEVRMLRDSAEEWRRLWKEKDSLAIFCTTCGLPCKLDGALSDCCEADVTDDIKLEVMYE